MTARDRIIADALAQLERLMEDNIREAQTRLLTQEGCEPVLETIDAFIARMREVFEQQKAQTVRALTAALNEDGTRAALPDGM